MKLCLWTRSEPDNWLVPHVLHVLHVLPSTVITVVIDYSPPGLLSLFHLFLLSLPPLFLSLSLSHTKRNTNQLSVIVTTSILTVHTTQSESDSNTDNELMIHFNCSSIVNLTTEAQKRESKTKRGKIKANWSVDLWPEWMMRLTDEEDGDDEGDSEWLLLLESAIFFFWPNSDTFSQFKPALMMSSKRRGVSGGWTVGVSCLSSRKKKFHRVTDGTNSA